MSEEKNKNDYDEIEDEFDDSEEFSFWSFRTIFTLFLMVLLIGAGIYSFNRDSEESIDEKVADIEETMEDESKDESSNEENKDETTESNDSSENTSSEQAESSDNGEEVKEEDQTDEPEKVDQVISTGEKVSVIAQSGEGVTNLARKAIADYISKNNIELSVEQKLFAETYIKDLYKSEYTGLNTGDSVEFDSNDITDTVSKAKDLSESQIKAWSKYVSLVPSLK